jgi:hypothetical protein
MRFPIAIALIVTCFLQVSCSRSRGPKVKDKVPLAKVKGKVLVDGQPASGVIVRYAPENPVAETRKEVLGRFYVMTNSKGDFALRTYANGDGVPFGDYLLTMTWFSQDKDEILRAGEVDKLGGQYAKTPYSKFKVEAAKEIDLGTIELKSPSLKKK